MRCRSGVGWWGPRGSASRLPEYGRDYRLGYSLAVVQGGAMSFQFGLDAQRRESLLQEKPDHSLVGRLTVGW